MRGVFPWGLGWDQSQGHRRWGTGLPNSAGEKWLFPWLRNNLAQNSVVCSRGPGLRGQDRHREVQESRAAAPRLQTGDSQAPLLPPLPLDRPVLVSLSHPRPRWVRKCPLQFSDSSYQK